MLELVSPNIVPPNVSDRLHFVYVSPDAQVCLGTLNFCVWKSLGIVENSSFVNNNNKSLEFLRKYYAPVIVLSFDHSIDHS